jgi:hypothetical protein
MSVTRVLRTTFVVPALAALLVAAPLTAVAAPAPTDPAADTAAGFGLAKTPYMGWSSWSMQSSKFPGLNPKGNYSYLSEANVLKQADAMAAKLKRFGYTYINIDAGWWMDWGWHQQYDGFGRQLAFSERFPHGIQFVADYIHRKGLKVGIYMPAGLEKGAYDNGDYPIFGAPGCSTHQVVFADLRTTNGWDSSYKFDFSKSCAQKYIDSIATMRLIQPAV